jgi:hypothetical protein
MTEGDYDGAITNARSLVEAVLTFIESKVDAHAPKYDGDLPKLYKRVQAHLNLSPENPKIAEGLKQVLRICWCDSRAFMVSAIRWVIATCASTSLVHITQCLSSMLQ